MIGITRYDYETCAGWLGRFYTEGRVMQHLFSDSHYGHDKGRSHAAAQSWLLAQLATTEPRPRFRRRRASPAGICQRYKQERRGRRILVYDVSYQLQGRRRTRSFRVHLFHSETQALYAACRFRRTMEDAMQCERTAALWQAWKTTPGISTGDATATAHHLDTHDPLPS